MTVILKEEDPMADSSNSNETAKSVATKSLTRVVVHGVDKGGVYQTSKRLKSLQVTRTKLLGTRKQSKEAIANHQGNIEDATRRLSEVEAEINSIQDSGTVVVSEHAILRYLERFEGVDLDAVAEKVKELPEHCFVRRGSTIVTILEADELGSDLVSLDLKHRPALTNPPGTNPINTEVSDE